MAQKITRTAVSDARNEPIPCPGCEPKVRLVEFFGDAAFGNASDIHHHLDRIKTILSSVAQEVSATQSAQMSAAQQELEKLSEMLRTFAK